MVYVGYRISQYVCVSLFLWWIVKWFESGVVKVILLKDLNDIYIMRIDYLDELKVIDKLYDNLHVLLYLFHPLMIMMIFFGLYESFIHPTYFL